MERSYREAVRHAHRRRLLTGQPIGVAVRRCWIDGESDGARAEVVVTDATSHEVGRGTVLVPRVLQWVETAAVEETLEAYALRSPARHALQSLVAAMNDGAVVLWLMLERIWLDSQAA